MSEVIEGVAAIVFVGLVYGLAIAAAVSPVLFLVWCLFG